MRTDSKLVLIIALLIGALARDAVSGIAHADAPAVVDRVIVERLVRAEEEQTRALQGIARQLERCRN